MLSTLPNALTTSILLLIFFFFFFFNDTATTEIYTLSLHDALPIINGIDGIVAECGGEMMCATCHVYVEPDQLDRTPPMSDDEKAMLEFTASERKPNSRLSCQLVATPEFDGLVVRLPEAQV